MIEKALEWFNIQYLYKTRWDGKKIDAVQSKTFGSIHFYFSEDEDEKSYIVEKKEEHKLLVEEKRKEVEASGEEFEERERIMWPDFIIEIMMTPPMIEQLEAGKSMKKIKMNRQN